MKKTSLRQKVLLLISIIGLALAVEAIAQCPGGGPLTANRTKLYLYFASASDSTFPEYGVDGKTSPLKPFKVSDLASGIGTTAQLSKRITDIVREDYCEFDLEVVSTTTKPSPAEPLWQIVGIGSDASFSVDKGDLYGFAQNTDVQNSEHQDFTRVYAGSFRHAFGPGTAEPALAGAKSTRERWAMAIGSTVSHEAGHNFGLNHTDAKPRPEEDATDNHILATGGELNGEKRAGRNRHFSDTSYEILGHNIGLRVKTLTNWDFTNPNAEEAGQFFLTLLSPATTLTLNEFFNGASSPWTNPTIIGAGIQSFGGKSYNKFILGFSSPKSWSGGPPGVVPGGAKFHTGVTLSESDPVIVYETRLTTSAGTLLSLHPRLIGFNSGTADFASGGFSIAAVSVGAPMIIEDLQVQFLPRMVSIESMIEGARLQDVRGAPVTASRPGESYRPVRSLEVKGQADIRVATFRDSRTVDIFHDKSKCKPLGSPGGSPQIAPTGKQGAEDADKAEIDYCPDGWSLSLFPSTYVYLVATVVDPHATYWDKAQARYVTGPLRSKVFHQFAGTLPDFNHNGIDDLIDIRTNAAPDKNNNGIVDGAETGGVQQPKLSERRVRWWWLLLLLLLVILLILWLLRRARRP